GSAAGGVLGFLAGGTGLIADTVVDERRAPRYALRPSSCTPRSNAGLVAAPGLRARLRQGDLPALGGSGALLLGGTISGATQARGDRLDNACYAPRARFRRALTAAGIGVGAAGVGAAAGRLAINRLVRTGYYRGAPVAANWTATGVSAVTSTFASWVGGNVAARHLPYMR
ncbi:MAG: hypothetical protein MI924_27510, partial [Chloroflexales bacterium]|nr:hypothetical protein [Chloroflexales bacterium]